MKMKKLLWSKIALSAALGGVYLTALDALHVIGGVIVHGPIMKGAVATPIRFAAISGVMSVVVPLLDASGDYGGDQMESTLPEVAIELGLLAGLYALTAFAPGAVAAGVLGGALAVRMISMRLSKPGDNKYVLILGIAGPLIEALLLKGGMFSYTQKDILGLPAWLPLLWGHGGFLARRMFSHPWFRGAA